MNNWKLEEVNENVVRLILNGEEGTETILLLRSEWESLKLFCSNDGTARL